MKKRFFNILKLFIILICFFSISKFLGMILSIFNINVSEFSPKLMVLIEFIISLIIFIALLIIYKKDIKKDYKEFKRYPKKNITRIIVSFIVFMLLKYLAGFITIIIMGLLKMDNSQMTSVNQNAIETYTKASPMLMFISGTILAPFYEEILFRMGFKKAFGKGKLYIILSGAIFGLMHIFPLSEGVSLSLGLVQSISYVTMGIFLAYKYNKNDNIFITIGVHLLNNLFSMLVMFNMF